eukprot:TRINITY_DN26744_c0_g1_i1.p1 TRINITY_DN26744_c0_g1~~TRINITY_DN26744_c0_g1_i1.p1  ORF type:complete len:1271 (+),score=384.72 TRINITY_DN26744_c0_g1_i1:37-3849(+)
MKDAISEERYQALRVKLNDLHYYQLLSVDSSLLAETMLNDLAASRRTFSELKQKDELQIENQKTLEAEGEGLRLENQRLQVENNSLHLQLIETGEAAEKQDAASRLRVHNLEDEAETLRLSLQSTSNQALKWEKELHALRIEAMVLLGCEDAEDCLARTGVLPTARPAPRANYDALIAQQEMLTSALGSCRQQVSDIDSKASAARSRMAKLQDAAAAAGQQIADHGPSPSTLQEKAGRARLEGRLKELRNKVVEGERERAELEQRATSLEKQRAAAQAKVVKLKAESEALRQEEAQAAELASQLHSSCQERARRQQLRQQEKEELHGGLRRHCDAMSSSNRSLASQIAQIARDEAQQLEAQSRQAEELAEELKSLSEANRKQQAALGDRTAQLRAKADEAEAECQAAAASQRALENEVSAAQSSSEQLLKQLVASIEKIETDIQSGAELQQRSQSSGAQIQLLTSSLLGLTAERQMLLANLQDKQQALHKESLRRVELQVEAQRLAAVVRSLDDTRDDWIADLNRSVTALRRAHTSLTTARKLEETASENFKRIKHEAEGAEAGVEVASRQRDELAAETQVWTQELRSERLRRSEIGAAVSASREQLLRLETKLKSASEVHALRLGSTGNELTGLQEDLRKAWVQRRRLEAQRSEAALAAQRMLQAEEESLVGMRGELETLLQHRDTIMAETAAAESVEKRRLDRVSNAAEQAASLETRHRLIAEKLHAEESSFQAAIQSEQHAAAEVAELQANLQEAERRATELAQSKILLVQDAELRRSELSTAEASEKSCQERLAASRNTVESMSVKCAELHEDIEQLVAAASAGEAARNQLSEELAARRSELTIEEKARERAAKSGAGWGEEQRAAAAQVAVLSKAVAALDSERDTQRRVADQRVEEASYLEDAIATGRLSLQSTQQHVDDLRANNCAQGEQMEQQSLRLESMRLHLQQSCASSEQLRVEARERSSEATTILEDLMHMTKENQELHEEIRVIEQRVNSRTGEARQRVAEQELSLQQLSALELERNDIARLCQQVSLQTRMQQAALERLQADHDLLKKATGEFATELHHGVSVTEALHNRSEELSLDSRVIEEQLAEIEGRLQNSEEAQLEKLQEDARLEGEIAAATAASQGADQREAAQNHAAASLRLRRQQLRDALQQTRRDAMAQHKSAQEGFLQVHRLEALLDEAQARRSRLAAEAEALRNCLSERRDAQGIAPVAEPSDLREQIERGYAEVGEMDAEQQQARAEVLRLRAELLQSSSAQMVR